MTPEAKREAVAHLCDVHEVSQSRACVVLNVDRSSVRYSSVRPDDADLRKAIRGVAHERRRFGYRRIAVMLERQGIYMNHKNSVDFIVKRSCKFASVAGVNGPKVHVDQWF